MQVARIGRVDALGEWLTCDGLDALRDSATTIVSRVTKIELGERNAERWNQHGYYRQAEEVERRSPAIRTVSSRNMRVAYHRQATARS